MQEVQLQTRVPSGAGGPPRLYLSQIGLLSRAVGCVAVGGVGGEVSSPLALLIREQLLVKEIGRDEHALSVDADLVRLDLEGGLEVRGDFGHVVDGTQTRRLHTHALTHTQGDVRGRTGPALSR